MKLPTHVNHYGSPLVVHMTHSIIFALYEDILFYFFSCSTEEIFLVILLPLKLENDNEGLPKFSSSVDISPPQSNEKDNEKMLSELWPAQ